MNSNLKDRSHLVESQSYSSSVDSDCNPSFDSTYSNTNFNLDSSSDSSLFDSQAINQNSHSDPNQMNQASFDFRDIKSKTTNPSGSETSHRRNGSSSQGHYSSGKHSLSKELGFGEGKTTSNQSHKSNSDSRSRSSHRRVASAPKHTLQPSNSNSSLKIARAAPRMIPLELAPSPPRAVQELTHVNKGSLGLADQGGRSLDDSHKPALKHKRTLKSMNLSESFVFHGGKDGEGRSRGNGRGLGELGGSYDLPPLPRSQAQPERDLFNEIYQEHRQEGIKFQSSKGRDFSSGLPNSHSHTSSSVQDGVWLDENKENDSSAFISTASRRYAKAAGSRYLFPPPPPTSSTPPPIPTNKFNQRESDSLIETSFPSSLLADREDSVYQLNPEVEDQDRLRVPFSEVPTNSPSTPNRREAPFDSQSSSPSQESPSIIKSVGKGAQSRAIQSRFQVEEELSDRRLGLLNELGLESENGKGMAKQVKDEQIELNEMKAFPSVESPKVKVKEENRFWSRKRVKSKLQEVRTKR